MEEFRIPPIMFTEERLMPLSPTLSIFQNALIDFRLLEITWPMKCRRYSLIGECLVLIFLAKLFLLINTFLMDVII